MAVNIDPDILAHLEWIGYVQPTGLVVSAPAMVRAGAILDRRDAEGQRLLRSCVEERTFPGEKEPAAWLPDFRAFATTVLGWSFSPRGFAGPGETARFLPNSNCRFPIMVRRCAPISPCASLIHRMAGRHGNCWYVSSSRVRISIKLSAAAATSRRHPIAAWNASCATQVWRRDCCSTAVRSASFPHHAAKARAGWISESRT